MARITVLGAGSWGTALASLLIRNGHEVLLWSYRIEQVEELRLVRENKSKLPGFLLPEELRYTSSIQEAVCDVDLIVMAVPSKATRETAEKIAPFLKEGQRIVSVSKGIEPGTLYTQCQIINDVIPTAITAVLSGPSHAEEVIQDLPTLVVCGSLNQDFALYLQEVFMNENFRVYASPDVIGIEIGGSCKNVIALAAGISDGLGFGDNAKAALITRGVKEITDLSLAMGGRRRTLNGLTGIGDLIVTCQSMHSRNRKAGFYIGQGMTYQEAMDEVQMVVEGVYSAEAALALGQKVGVDLPIISEVNEVLFYGKDVRMAARELMTRDRKSEI